MTAPVETIAGWELWRDKDGPLRAEYPDGNVSAYVDDGALRVSLGRDDSRCAVIVPVALAERLIADARDRGILSVLAIVAAKDVRPDEPRLWLRTSAAAQLDRITPADLHTERRRDGEPWAAVVATARLDAAPDSSVNALVLTEAEFDAWAESKFGPEPTPQRTLAFPDETARYRTEIAAAKAAWQYIRFVAHERAAKGGGR